MQITDIDLYMKFQRQPRVLGTICYYAPKNKLLIPDGIKRGEKVFIVDYTQSKDDVYVTVANVKYWTHRFQSVFTTSGLDIDIFKDYVKNRIPPSEKVMVIWKDLAQ
jgi:hypothetical protein